MVLQWCIAHVKSLIWLIFVRLCILFLSSIDFAICWSVCNVSAIDCRDLLFFTQIRCDSFNEASLLFQTGQTAVELSARAVNRKQICLLFAIRLANVKSFVTKFGYDRNRWITVCKNTKPRAFGIFYFSLTFAFSLITLRFQLIAIVFFFYSIQTLLHALFHSTQMPFQYLIVCTVPFCWIINTY